MKSLINWRVRVMYNSDNYLLFGSVKRRDDEVYKICRIQQWKLLYFIYVKEI